LSIQFMALPGHKGIGNAQRDRYRIACTSDCCAQFEGEGWQANDACSGGTRRDGRLGFLRGNYDRTVGESRRIGGRKHK
jgi:hypothetical protein